MSYRSSILDSRLLSAETLGGVLTLARNGQLAELMQPGECVTVQTHPDRTNEPLASFVLGTIDETCAVWQELLRDTIQGRTLDPTGKYLLAVHATGASIYELTTGEPVPTAAPPQPEIRGTLTITAEADYLQWIVAELTRLPMPEGLSVSSVAWLYPYRCEVSFCFGHDPVDALLAISADWRETSCEWAGFDHANNQGVHAVFAGGRLLHGDLFKLTTGQAS